MKQFKINRRIKPTGGDFAVMGLLVILAVTIALLLLTGKQGSGKYLQIWQNGELLEEIQLDGSPEERFLELNGKYHNTIVITGSSAGFVDSDCPNQDCVHKGMISQVGESAVCLPNRVVLEITDKEKSADVDAFVG